MTELHKSLDNFAEGWKYRITTGSAVSDQRQIEIRDHNEEFCSQAKERGKGTVISRINLLVPTNESAMAIRLAWPSTEIVRSEEELAGRKTPLGERV